MLKSWSLSTEAPMPQVFTSKRRVQLFSPWCFMKKRDGKAAFSTQSTKQLFIQRCCFPHTAQRWAALTFTLRWLCPPPVIGGEATERNLYLCVCAGMTQPSTRICFGCSTKSPLLLLQQQQSWFYASVGTADGFSEIVISYDGKRIMKVCCGMDTDCAALTLEG